MQPQNKETSAVKQANSLKPVNHPRMRKGKTADDRRPPAQRTRGGRQGK